MIEAKDLRIGNLVTIDNPEYYPKLRGMAVRVASLSERTAIDDWEGSDYALGVARLDRKETYSQYRCFFSPILLTEEWLERLGFYMRPEDNEFSISDDCEFTIGKNKDSNHWFCYEIKMDGFAYFEYVHELQNLFNALTRKELDIKTT